MKIAPPARMDDGELDIVLLGDLSRVELVSQIWKLYPGTHLRNPHVHWTRGKEVTFTPEIARSDRPRWGVVRRWSTLGWWFTAARCVCWWNLGQRKFRDKLR